MTFMRAPLVVCMVACLTAACQPATGVGTSISKVVKKPAAVRAAQPASTAPGPVSQPGQPTPSVATSPTAPSTVPSSAPTLPSGGTSPAPAISPTIFRPSQAPDAPIPSGYVSPLPDSAFPSPTVVSPLPTVSSTPVPAPSLLDAVVVSNSLLYGNGELTGYVVEPDPATEGAYRPVSGVSVSIVYDEDTTKKATLTNATNGTYRLPEVALGAYNVRVEKSGYAADSAPTTVRIYPGYQSGHTVFLILKEQ